MEYINTTAGIAFGLVYCNAVTSKTDLYVHLLTSCNHVCEQSVSWKVLKNVFLIPGKHWRIWSLQVLESPGKQYFNACTNPEGQSGHDPLKFIEKGCGQGHVTPKFLGVEC